MQTKILIKLINGITFYKQKQGRDHGIFQGSILVHKDKNHDQSKGKNNLFR